MPRNPGNLGDGFVANTWLQLPYVPKDDKDKGDAFRLCPSDECEQVMVAGATEEFILAFAFRVTCPRCLRVVDKQAHEPALTLVVFGDG